MFYPAHTVTFPLSKVTTSVPSCQSSIILSLTKVDGTTTHSDVFSTSFDATGLHLTMQTDNPSKAMTYNMILWATFNGITNSIPNDNTPFTVVIDNPCAAATLTIDPTILSSTSITYTIGGP